MCKTKKKYINTIQKSIRVGGMKIVTNEKQLTKILSENITKWDIFFNIVPFVIHVLIHRVTQFIDPIFQVVIY